VYYNAISVTRKQIKHDFSPAKSRLIRNHEVTFLLNELISKPVDLSCTVVVKVIPFHLHLASVKTMKKPG
jgi:hypothetical protein